MMRVLITGGAGFLGSHLCDRFLSENHDVIAMDNLITGNTGNIEHLAGHDRSRYSPQAVDMDALPGTIAIPAWSQASALAEHVRSRLAR